ncbi:2-isopropylmalate synthase [Oscillospiraceae bacterium PP1C4]
MSRQIKIFDTTLRDGEQSPGCSMNFNEKIEMAYQLERLGVDIIEAGFPISSPDDFASVKAIAQKIKTSTIAGLSRCVEGDIQRTYDAVKFAEAPRIHVFLATSDIHMKYKLKMTPEQVIERTAAMVKFARSLCSDIEFSAEDASRSNRDFLVRVFDTAIAAGATTINIPDTVGYSTPNEMYDLISYIKAHLQNPHVDISVHNHNDLGMGVANTLSCIRAGATQVECTINGIGERAGNAALDEIVMTLHTRKDYYDCTTNINTKQIYRTSKLLTTITGVGVSPNKPIVGANAFAHESGIHQHGVLEERTTYEIMSPDDIGIYRNKMVLGKHSGKHAFADRISELGYKMSDADIAEAFERFKILADRKKDISDKDIEALIGSAAFSEIKETYVLKNFVINSGTVISATATVCLIKDNEEEIEHVARGEGPIDAAFKAIDRIVKMDSKLENWAMQAVTEGEDALGEAISKITCNGHLVTGRGLSPDILEASIKSYINAINKAIAVEISSVV